jgi:hypothetical protein
MLASTSLGNNLGLAQSPREEQLPQGIVDLVAAGVVQILSLQPDVGTASVLRQALS